MGGSVASKQIMRGLVASDISEAFISRPEHINLLTQTFSIGFGFEQLPTMEMKE